MEKVMEELMVMVERITNSSRMARHFNTDVDIFRSEIHIITLIGDSNQLHVSEIARKLGVTKGAVSQSIKKLEKKGLVQKFVDESNNTRLLVRLTEKGHIAYDGHEEHHQIHDREILSYLEALNEHELDMIITFIKKVSRMSGRHL